MFGNNKIFGQNLAFLNVKADCFPKIWPLIFDFSTLMLHFMLDPEPDPQHCLYTNFDIKVFLGFMHGAAYSRCEP
jgi:hypothetical protein